MAKKAKSFEEYVERLEEIIDKIEDPSTFLEDSIKLYKEGMDISLSCKEILEKAEKEVLVLTKGLDSNFVLENFQMSED